MGSFQMKASNPKQSLAINHPDECRLLYPTSQNMNVESVGSTVKVRQGKVRFLFDCDGKEIEVAKVVRKGEHTWDVDPREYVEEGFGIIPASSNQ